MDSIDGVPSCDTALQTDVRMEAPSSRMDFTDRVPSHVTATSLSLPDVAPESRVTGPATPLGLPQMDVDASSSRMDSIDGVPSCDTALQPDVRMEAPSLWMDSTDGVPSHVTATSLSLLDVALSALKTDVLMDPPSLGMDSTNCIPSHDTPVALGSPEVAPSTSQTDLSNLEKEVDLIADELHTASKKDILTLYPPTPSVQPPPQVQYLEDLVHYRYGYCLSKTPYQCRLPAFASDSLKSFESWYHVCNAMGGQGLPSSTDDHAPITDFLVVLMYSKRLFHDVPGKYWDLSPGNIKPLKLFTPLHFQIEVKRFQDHQLCLLHPHSQTSTADWTIAVGATTSLECIRRCLGPSSIDVAEFLIKHGISFRTLTPPSTLSENGPVKPHRLLGHRSKSHKFDLADFVSYETLRESFLVAQPQGRRALSYGGIVARLARETLPDSVVLAGPSYQALQGQQEIFGEGKDILVDDQLSEDDLDFICGTYVVETGIKSMHEYSECWNNLTYSSSGQTAIYSWFPRANIWEGSGFNVGFWNQECERWYLKHRSKILDGTAVPLSGKDWRQEIRKYWRAPQLSIKMDNAALEFLQSSQGDPFTLPNPL